MFLLLEDKFWKVVLLVNKEHFVFNACQVLDFH